MGKYWANSPSKHSKDRMKVSGVNVKCNESTLGKRVTGAQSTAKSKLQSCCTDPLRPSINVEAPFSELSNKSKKQQRVDYGHHCMPSADHRLNAAVAFTGRRGATSKDIGSEHDQQGRQTSYVFGDCVLIFPQK